MLASKDVTKYLFERIFNLKIMGPALQIVIIVFCIIFSAYFSATETAFSTFNRIRIKNMAEKGNKKAARVLALSDNFDTLISTILIGNNLVNILSTSLATILFISLCHNNQDLGSTVSTIVMTVIVLIFGEITPKTLAKKRPEAFAIFSAPIINALLIILYPFSFIFKAWQSLISKMLKKEEDEGVTEDELISIIEEAEEEGGLDKEDGELIKSAIEFNELEVGDVFTPRIDITAISKDATYDEVAKVFSDSGYSRLPIYDGDIDNILGIVYYKDFFNEAFDENSSLTDISKPVIYVAKAQKINDLLKDLQNKQMHMAVVLDEYGSTAGIVTLEDILEEIVGEIWDEHDERIEEIQQVGEKEYIVSGMASISKVLDTFDIDEEPDSANANGWAMDVLGKMPEVGDTFEEYGLAVEILETNGKRVEHLKIVDIRESEDEDEEKSEDEDEKND